MKTDTVIELKDNNSYLLLLESELDAEAYFLANQLDANNEPTNNYAVIQEVRKDNKTFAKKIDDPIILNKLLEDYRLQYEELYGE